MKLAFLILALVGSLAGYEQVPPNIIFLMADDQNTLSMGCYGNPEVETPNMDRLAKDGMIFDRHYDTTAICMGSRANVFTGMYEYKTGCNFVHGDMSNQIWSRSYPTRLREAGYLTAFAGKFGIVVDGKGICEDEFDFYGGAKGQTNYATSKNSSMQRFAKKYPHSTLSYGAFGKEVIRKSVEKKKPFCLSISFKAPHRPTTPDPRFDHVYKGKKIVYVEMQATDLGVGVSEVSIVESPATHTFKTIPTTNFKKHIEIFEYALSDNAIMTYSGAAKDAIGIQSSPASTNSMCKVSIKLPLQTLLAC